MLRLRKWRFGQKPLALTSLNRLTTRSPSCNFQVFHRNTNEKFSQATKFDILIDKAYISGMIKEKSSRTLELFAGGGDSKRVYGQFFTTGNPFDCDAFGAWAKRAGLPKETVLEPFAGSNALIRHLTNFEKREESD